MPERRPLTPSLADPRNRYRRQFGLVILAGSTIGLIPWIGYLVVTLPQHYTAHQWGIAWVGFDVGLVFCLAMTSWTVWTMRQLAVPWAIITATLLVCDAWFDVALDWGTSDLPISVATALLGELPLAGLLFYAARRMIRLTLLAAWTRMGLEGPVPPLHKVTLIMLGAVTEGEVEE